MRNLILTATFAAAMALPASAATYTYYIGDIDNFGGDYMADSRSADEASATDGAQYTDLGTGVNGYAPFTDDDFPLHLSFDIDDFASIDSIELGIYALGIQSNDTNPLTFSQAEDGLTFEGSLVSEFFAGVEQGSRGHGLISAVLDPSLYSNALDGLAEFTILLNSMAGTDDPDGEPASFDYFYLTVEGKLGDGPGPASVPVPAGLPLMVSALAGFGLIRRRAKRA